VLSASSALIGATSDRLDVLEVMATHHRGEAFAAAVPWATAFDGDDSTLAVDPVLFDALDHHRRVILDAWAPASGPAGDEVSAPHASADDEVFAPVLAVPLAIGGATFGLLIAVRHPSRLPFTLEDADVASSFAEDAMTAIDAERTRRRRCELDTQQDRARIGRDIHDIVIQRLYAAALRLETLAATVPSSPASSDIRATMADIDGAIGELRSTIHDLRSPTASASAADRIDTVIRTQSSALGFIPTVVGLMDVDDVSSECVDQLIPTLTEALANVARHSGATAVRIEFDIGPSVLTMRVMDNGIGVGAVGVDGVGHGLGNMADRARGLGGTCELRANASQDADPARRGGSLIWSVPRRRARLA
jgi:signal transduction histidine kinase